VCESLIVSCSSGGRPIRDRQQEHRRCLADFYRFAGTRSGGNGRQRRYARVLQESPSIQHQFLPKSKGKAQRKLQFALRIDNRRNSSGGGHSECCIRKPELRRVEQVEGFGAELEISPFSQRDKPGET
jgi:hypothetical protein